MSLAKLIEKITYAVESPDREHFYGPCRGDILALCQAAEVMRESLSWYAFHKQGIVKNESGGGLFEQDAVAALSKADAICKGVEG